MPTSHCEFHNNCIISCSRKFCVHICLLSSLNLNCCQTEKKKEKKNHKPVLIFNILWCSYLSNQLLERHKSRFSTFFKLCVMYNCIII